MPHEKDARAMHRALERRANWLWHDVGVRDRKHFAYSAEIENYFGDVRDYLLADAGRN